MQPASASQWDPRQAFGSAPIRLHQTPLDPDPDDPDWDPFLPDEEETYPEPGDFWIEDDDWEDAA